MYLDWDSPYSDTAIRLKTQAQSFDTSGAYFPTFLTNGTHLITGENGYLDFKQGGEPFPHRPTQLTGYYRLVDTLSAIDHFGRCRILLKKFNPTTQAIDTVGYTDSQLELSPSLEWKPFSIPIAYRSDTVPDSLVILFNPSVFPDEAAELWLDELAFTYNPSSTLPQEVDLLSPTIYPNPVRDQIHINPYQISYDSFRLLDASGRVLLEGPFKRLIDISKYGQKKLILQLQTSEGSSQAFSLFRVEK